jgi:hypothetical protein
MNQPQCPICHPPQLDIPPPEEAGHPELAAAAQARADIERLRTAHLAVAPTGTDDLP